MKKKKVAFLINSLGLGGAERVVSILLNALKDHEGFSFELILLEDEHFYSVPKEIKTTVLSNLTWSDSALKRTLYIPLLAYRLKKYIKDQEIDFVLSFIYRSDFVNVLASFLAHHRYALSNRVNASTTYADGSLSSKINNFLIKTLYPKAPLIINVSHGLKHDLSKHYHIPMEKQTVIYNPYEIKKIEKLALEPLDFKTDKAKTIVVASRLDPIKNIHIILDAVARVKEDVKLVIIGEGSQSDALKRQAKELGLAKNVTFTGLQDNPYKYMNNASIYISASSSEGFPNALVEAMICQCAVISTDCPSGPREILAPKSGYTFAIDEGVEYAPFGLLTAVGDRDALVEAITFYLQNPKEKEAYAQKGYQRAQTFDITAVTQSYLNTIKKELSACVA